MYDNTNNPDHFSLHFPLQWFRIYKWLWFSWRDHNKGVLWRKAPQLRFHPGTWVKQCMCSVVPCVKLMKSHCLTFAYKQTPYVVIIYWSDVIKSAWWHEWNTVTENCTSSYHVWQKTIISPRIFAMNSSYFNHVLFNTTSVQCQIWTAMSFIELWHSEVKMCLMFIICLRWRPCLNWFWKSIL